MLSNFRFSFGDISTAVCVYSEFCASAETLNKIVGPKGLVVLT